MSLCVTIFSSDSADPLIRPFAMVSYVCVLFVLRMLYECISAATSLSLLAIEVSSNDIALRVSYRSVCSLLSILLVSMLGST